MLLTRVSNSRHGAFPSGWGIARTPWQIKPGAGGTVTHLDRICHTLHHGPAGEKETEEEKAALVAAAALAGGAGGACRGGRRGVVPAAGGRLAGTAGALRTPLGPGPTSPFPRPLLVGKGGRSAHGHRPSMGFRNRAGLARAPRAGGDPTARSFARRFHRRVFRACLPGPLRRHRRRHRRPGEEREAVLLWGRLRTGERVRR